MVSVMSCCRCVCQENGDTEYMDFMWREFEEIESSLENVRQSTVQQVGKIRQQLMSGLAAIRRGCV